MMAAARRCCGYNLVVLGGELAVPFTSNPLQLG